MSVVVSGALACVSLGGLADQPGIVDASTPPPDAEGSADGQVPEAAACLADTAIDPKNCGRCGHDCLGGQCDAGRCAPFTIARVGLAALTRLVLTPSYLFGATSVRLATEPSGVWRLARPAGVVEPYVLGLTVHGIATINDTLYFIVVDLPANGAGQTGGLYSCPIAGPAPCTPTLVAPADRAADLASDQTTLLYASVYTGLTRYRPPGPPELLVPAGSGDVIFADPLGVFYASTIYSASPYAALFEVDADGGVVQRHAFSSTEAVPGRVRGDRDAIFYSAYDYTKESPSVLHRHPRSAGELSCELGGSTNARPYDIHLDGARVYWTNLGEGSTRPYTRGSVVSCPRKGCCSQPDVLWTGEGMPTAITGDADALYFTTTGFIWKLAKP